MGNRTAEQDLVVELARAAVDATAPDELTLFDDTSAAFLRRPVGPEYLTRAGKADGPLTFGVDVWVPVVSIAALGAAQSVLIFLGAEIKSALREESSSTIRAWVKRLLARFQPSDRQEAAPVAVPRLTPEQLATVRQRAYEQALAFKMPPAKAEIMADAIVGRLSLPDAGE